MITTKFSPPAFDSTSIFNFIGRNAKQCSQHLKRDINFSTLDWAIVIVYPMISLGIGWYARRFVRTRKDFVCADQGIGTALGIATLTQDVIAPLLGDKLTPKQRILMTRVLIVVIGLYVLGWGLLYQGTLDIFDYMGVTGVIYYTGAFALLLGGLYWKRASSTGAFLALLAGSTACVRPHPAVVTY